jgi:1,4-alpha-glucan branching enzyme
VTRRGQLALVLHAHLPFIRHPEHERFLEEHWLFEAISDCYLPLLKVLRGAEERGSRFRLTLSLSPTLLSQLRDRLLRERFLDYLDRRLRLCESEIGRQGNGGKGQLARWYRDRFVSLRRFYLDDIDGDLIDAWRKLRDAGLLELITTTATHGYLPLLRSRGSAVYAQLGVGRDTYRALVGGQADGLWLPECGYYPGLEQPVLASGFRYTILEAHGIQQGEPRPPWDVYAPADCGGLALFGRDPFSAREVWSREAGYPGCPVYREYHRDLGYEAQPGELAGFLPQGVEAAPTGIKYYRVTGGDGTKALYEPEAAAEQAARDAGKFVTNRARLFDRFPQSSRPPLVVAPYDAELLGHWWFEGPWFLNALIRELDETPELEPVTLGGYLARYGTAGSCRAATSSWGERGYNAAWLRPETGRVHLELHQAALELEEMLGVHRSGQSSSLEERLLRQAARSLLLAQGSDWTFHLGRGGGTDYARTRLNAELARFAFLVDALRRGRDPGNRLDALERMDNLFPGLDLTHFGKKE